MPSATQVLYVSICSGFALLGRDGALGGVHGLPKGGEPGSPSEMPALSAAM